MFDMDFTFGICSVKDNESLHKKIVDSIMDLNIPNFEILFIGHSSIDNEKIKVIEFDESEKSGWITRKKNILCKCAKYENIVLLHDYIFFYPNWYEGFLEHGNDFQVCTNQILNYNGLRFRDWCLNPYDVIPPIGPIDTREFFLPYEENRLNDKMYISGAYWVAKTKFMLDHPLNENLTWAQSEDIEWSIEARNFTKFQFNKHSIVQCLKYKHCDFTPISQENINKLLYN